MASILTDLAPSVATARLRGSGAEPLYVGWGTGAGTAAATDTALFDEKALNLSDTSGTRIAGTSSQVTTTKTNDTYQVVATLTAAGPGTVTNIGQFDNSTIGSGNLFSKSDFAGVALESGESITFTLKTQYS